MKARAAFTKKKNKKKKEKQQRHAAENEPPPIAIEERRRKMKVPSKCAAAVNSANYAACQLRSSCQLPLDEAENNAPINYDNY